MACPDFDMTKVILLGLLMISLPQAKSLGIGEDICKHCYCNNKETVVCDYAHNRTLSRILNSDYSVPTNVKIIKLKLVENLRLELHDGFFRDNMVNRFTLMGVGIHDQVELTKDAFNGNHGGYPEYQILNVSTVFVRSNAFSGGELKFQVENSQELVLYPNAIGNVNMSCNFKQIQKLTMNERAFSPSTYRSATTQVKLHIENAYIESIYSFDVSMHSIKFVNCRIDNIQESAFDVTNINNLIFRNGSIRRIDAKAFTNKLKSDHVSFTSTEIGTIASEAISGSGIDELVLKNNRIKNIDDHAIAVTSIKVDIEGNEIRNSGDKWLTVNLGEQLSINKNRFEGDFGAMQLDARLKCSFAKNYLARPQLGSLNFTRCRVYHTVVERECDCDMNWINNLTSHDIKSEVYCQLPGSLGTCFNASTLHLRSYENEICAANRSKVHCLDGSIRHKYQDGFITEEEKIKQKKSFEITSLALIVVAMVAIIGCVMLTFFWYICIRHHRKRPRQSSDSMQCPLTEDQMLRVRRVLNNESNLPKGLRKNLEILMSAPLTTEQCQKQIFHIVHDTPNLPTMINQVLSEHLADMGGAGGASSEDTQPMATSDYYTTTGREVVMLATAPTPSSTPPASPQPSVTEPVYEEVPNRPLLHNEYASPIDDADLNTEHREYAVPFNPRDPHDMPPAYEAMPQYAQPQRKSTSQVPQLPQLNISSTASNSHRLRSQLPDVLYRSQPPTSDNAGYAMPVLHATAAATRPVQPSATTETNAQRHVRDLRQDLENRPQFHPDQLSSERNQRHLQTSYYPRRNQYSFQPKLPATATISNNHHRTIFGPGGGGGGVSSSASFACLDGAASLAAMEHMDMRGATALPAATSATTDTGSNHSGGSNETVKMDDVMAYADA